MSRFARRAMMAVVAASAFAVSASAQQSAHSLADKFAAAAEKEAADRSAEEQAAKVIEAKRKAAEARRAAEAKRRAEAEAAHRARLEAQAQARLAEERRLEEAEMLARARREVEDMRFAAEEARLTEETRKLILQAEREREKVSEMLARESAAIATDRGSPKAAASERVAASDRGPERVSPPPAAMEEAQKGSAPFPPRPDAASALPRDAAADMPPYRQDVAAAPEVPAPKLPPDRPAAAPDAERVAQTHADDARRLAEKLKRVREIREARLAARAREAEAKARESVSAATEASNVPAPETPSDGPVAVAEQSGSARHAPAGERAVEFEPAGAAPAADQAGTRVHESAPAAQRLQDTRVTVLLTLEPGTYGIRRGNRTADPILCLPDGCYISFGPDRPAKFLPGRRALGFGNTWGLRAAACRGSLRCVFRDVDLGRLPGYVQPVDLHILKHDRRRPQVVRTDSGCRVENSRLLCNEGIYSEDYAMWIVPEKVAEAAGAVALQRALAEGLAGPRSAALSERLRP